MPYPETIKYIKQQIEKGVSSEKIKKSLTDAGYLPDVIDQLLDKAGVVKQEKKAAGIEKLILKDIGIGVVLLLIIGSLIYINFLKGSTEMLSPETPKNLNLDFSGLSQIELEKDTAYTLDISKYVKDKKYSLSELSWDYRGSICLNIQFSGTKAVLTSVFLPDCPYEEKLQLEVKNPDGETASDIIKVVIV